MSLAPGFICHVFSIDLGFEFLIRLIEISGIYLIMENDYRIGLVRRTSSFGRKRVFILNEFDIGSVDIISPTKKRSVGNSLGSERSLLEALPQDVIVSV